MGMADNIVSSSKSSLPQIERKLLIILGNDHQKIYAVNIVSHVTQITQGSADKEILDY